MSTLTGLYISQSYGGVIHLSTNTGIVAGTPTLLEDGLGNSLGLFIRSNGSISGSSFTGSLAGTASYASYALTASYALNTATSSTNFLTDITVSGAQIGRMTSSLSTNLIFGSGSLKKIEPTLAQRNIVIGDQSMENNVTSSNNIVIGNQSFRQFNGDAGANIVIGGSVGENLKSNVANGMVLIGYDVLSAATSHSLDHVAIGYGVLASHISGTYNVGIGPETLTSLTSGSNNVAIGGQAMEFATVASDATAIGYEAGFNIIGTGNLHIGARAGRDVSGSYNTFIGTDNTGITGFVTTGSNNTIIGSRINLGVGNKNINNNIVLATGDGNVLVHYKNDATFNIYGNPTIIHADTTIVGYISQSIIDIQSTNAQTLSGGTTGYRLSVSSSGDLYFRSGSIWQEVMMVPDAGEFWSTNSQSGSAGVSGSVTFNNSGSVSGVSVVSNSRLTVAKSGLYNIQFSAQVETSAGADTLYIWFKKNGSNIAASNTKAILANNTAQVVTVNILDQANVGDYYQIAYQTANGNATLKAETASGNLPAIPSVIATVIQLK